VLHHRLGTRQGVARVERVLDGTAPVFIGQIDLSPDLGCNLIEGYAIGRQPAARLL
jgi:hypothetical protein